MIKIILNKIAKYIPVYWPLQSFVPSNPLLGLIERPFDEVLHDVAKYALINGTLKIEDYHRDYYLGKINLSNLQAAVNEFIQTKGLAPEIIQQLTELFLDKSFQHELEVLFNSEVKLNSILISSSYERRDVYIESHKVKNKILKFLASFFDLGQAKWQLPVMSNELFKAWKEYTVVENGKLAAIIQNIPDEPIAALNQLLCNLNIAESLWHDYLLEILFQVIGWASLIQWLENNPTNPFVTKEASLASLCAIWLCYESLMPKFSGFNLVTHRSKIDDRLQYIIARQIAKHTTIVTNWKVFTKYNVCLIWQRALELHYQTGLINLLLTNPIFESNDQVPDAQAIFCLDIRSEGLRRNIENRGNYTTFGYAGYFGIGFKFNDEESHKQTLQNPPLNRPNFTLNKISGKKKLFGQVRDMLTLGLGKTKSAFFAPVELFDIVGIWFSLKLFYKTLVPSKLRDFKHNITYTSLNVFATPGGFSVEQLTEIASSVLTCIGLTQNFSKFVVITAHMTECENNPYESSLNCGACGSNSGIPNAIAFCQALNCSELRIQLAKQHNINIPEATVFICACHNTATDKLTYFNEYQIKPEDLIKFKKIRHDFDLACADLRQEKQFSLGELNASTKGRAGWAELIPEPGQANNAAFIIGPRKLSRRLNLERRAFLQSYDPELDTDGSILEGIFNGPLLITHGINSQYYFSTTDQKLYGSGNKALQNIISRLGVIEGNSSDLKIGYSKQSISYQGRLIHEPLRMLVIVYAKQALIDQILINNPQLAYIFAGNWATLKVIEL